ncbi:MAG TPA: 50S ribosomal protein L21e [Candidatus Pacearchaeota archaeon]|jgi:large subunit ribosomal protein L21e|nr:50S ribosomal protein L21e [Candidatus Pacearchaeota archaeon]
MVGKKKVRTRGKIRLSRYFQEMKKGDFVAVVREPSVQSSFPVRIQGRTGKVEGRRGKAYMINLRDQDKEKKFLIEPIHLKKIKVKELE